jgi:hypothetical protein
VGWGGGCEARFGGLVEIMASFEDVGIVLFGWCSRLKTRR